MAKKPERKVVLVTGSGRKNGAATAKFFVQHNYRVFAKNFENEQRRSR